VAANLVEAVVTFGRDLFAGRLLVEELELGGMDSMGPSMLAEHWQERHCYWKAALVGLGGGCGLGSRESWAVVSKCINQS